jgi:hypothetical protein
METTMIEFSLSIDMGKAAGVTRNTQSMSVDRTFIAKSLTDLAAKIQAGRDPRGTILDEKGTEVGSWKFAVRLPAEG